MGDVASTEYAGAKAAPTAKIVLPAYDIACLICLDPSRKFSQV